ncbi:MAG: hypothetical protein WCV69_02125 [Patescibacteria group bacterium]|jgi:hypothetical protein
MSEKIIYYFGFGTNKDRDMMEHMVGRRGLIGEPGQLPGYEVCIQRTDQFRTEIPKNSPLPVAPKDLILKSWGPNFEMFVSRPNPEAVAYGTIWQLTPEELEYVREWEIVDYGAQEDAFGTAINEKGEKFKVITQSFMKPPAEIDRVVHGPDYDPYIWDKQAMLDRADEIREQYSGLKKKGLIKPTKIKF